MINHELWRLVASGFLTVLLDELVAITNNDTRARLIEAGAFDGKLLISMVSSLAYMPQPINVRKLWDAVQNPITDPMYREDIIPLPENARVDSGTTLACDNVPSDHTVYVYEWEEFRRFVELGDLASNSTPGPGTYVLALRDDEANSDGLPSGFLTIS